jgi:hypothetical protein
MAYKFEYQEIDSQKISEDAEKFCKDYKESSQFQTGVPVCFLGDGTYIFRIYPDRDAKGWPRIIKRAWIHGRIPVDEKRSIRFWADDRVDKLLEEAAETGLEKLWGKFLYQYRSREQGYMMAHFYEVPAGQEYTKKGESYATVLDRRATYAIQNFIAELHPNDKKQLLDPNLDAPGLRLQITKAGSKSNVSCGIAGMTKLSLPPLEFKDDDGKEIEYKGLDYVYIKETDKVSDEDFFKIRQNISAEIQSFKSNNGPAVDKSAEAHRIGDKVPNNSNSKETNKIEDKVSEAREQAKETVTTKSKNDIECRLYEQGKASEKVRSQYPDARYGNKPEKSNPYCLACDWESECEDATAKAKAAA